MAKVISGVISGTRLGKYAAGLLAASMLVPAIAMAQTADDESIEDRLDRLEAMIVSLQEQVAGQAAATPQQAEVVSQLSTAVAETRAQNEALATQQSVTEERLAKVEKDSTNGFRVGDTTVKIGGYVKLDGKSISTSGGELPSGSAGLDFLIPSLIPVGGSSSG